MQNDIKPVPGKATDSALPQANMVVPAENVLPRTSEENARQGGSIFTKAFAADETRPQELHGSVQYQKDTADPGAVPKFVVYTDLTKPRTAIRG